MLRTTPATAIHGSNACQSNDGTTQAVLPVTLEDSAFRTFMLFMQVGAAASKYADSRFYKVNRLSMAKYLALTALAMNGGTLIHSDLATWTNTRRHNITTLVERMKKEGLVSTRQRERDKRFIEVTMTETGREALESAGPTARSIVYRLMNGIGENEGPILEMCLQTMGQNIK